MPRLTSLNDIGQLQKDALAQLVQSVEQRFPLVFKEFFERNPKATFLIWEQDGLEPGHLFVFDSPVDAGSKTLNEYLDAYNGGELDVEDADEPLTGLDKFTDDGDLTEIGVEI